MERELKNYINSLAANTTYVVSEDCTITTNLTFPANVTLIFKGGKIRGSYTVTGNNTSLVAPIVQIFDIALSFKGTWTIERAYPQWFGAIAYRTTYINAAFDSSAAINKAILMKSTGEVFIPRGYYRINKTIEVKNGIVLTGETGLHSEEGKSEEKIGTVLVAGAENLSSYTNAYFMRINMGGEDTWEVEYSNTATVVKNIRFINAWKNIPNLKCICVGGTFEVDTCYWKYFKQAIYTTNNYADLKKVVNCTYMEAGDIHSGNPLYVFDLSGLGDGLVFQRNAIHGFQSTHKALFLNQCNGGIITSNIMNNDVLIRGSKAITLNSNHLEAGAQVVIENSNVNSMNNFFEKRSRPNLVIRSTTSGNTPVVKSSGDLFLFYDKERSNVEDICEYDVQVNNLSLFQISQSYRYWVVAESIGTIYSFGIAISKEEGKIVPDPLTDFNEQSHLLSSDSRVMSGFHVVNAAYANSLSAPSCYGYGLSNYAKWLKNTGAYYYKYQILWDKKRRISGNNNAMNWYITKQNFINMTKNGPGVLFHLSNASNSSGNQVMIRLYRGASATVFSEYVDIPVIGTINLYDNGFSVCGFRWKPLTTAENLTSTNTNIISIRYSGANVECKAPTAPTSGTWTTGDIVYNTGSGANALWINNGSSWLAK